MFLLLSIANGRYEMFGAPGPNLEDNATLSNDYAALMPLIDHLFALALYGLQGRSAVDSIHPDAIELTGKANAREISQ